MLKLAFMNKKSALRSFLCCLVLILALGADVMAAGKSTAGKAKPGRMAVVSLGQGKVALLWPPVLSLYTGGGWQLQDVRSGKIVARWTAKDLERGLASLPAERRAKLRPFVAELRTMKDRKKAAEQVSWLLMGAMTDFKLARKLGMGCLLEAVPRGKRSYRLMLLNRKNKPTGRKMTSPAVDGWRAAPPPAPVVDLRGTSGSDGMELYWLRPEKQAVPTPVFQVSRKGEGGKEELLTPEPLWLPRGLDPEKPAFVDITAPLETRLTYTVRLQDVFGRLSTPASVTVLHADLDALRPPEKIKAEPGVNRVELSWELRDNPSTSGYAVERSRRRRGIYEVLTAKGLSRSTSRFLDKTAQGGFAYYYRVRSVGPRGDVGSPSEPVAVMVKTAGKPAAPADVKAEVSPTRIHLHWRPLPLPVAGYIIEKKTEKDDAWVRLNSSLATLSQFDDPVNLGDYGRRRYRVTAVAFGNQKSRPSREVVVQLPGRPPVPTPFLADVRADEGVIKLTFHASEPAGRTDHFLLVRGNSIEDVGLVIEKDLKGSETVYEDRLVKPGEDYWYALIAVDRDGRRSEMGNKLFVVAGSPEIPRPAQPAAKLLEKPFHRVKITFAEPAGYLRAAVMRKLDDGPWVTIARDVAGVNEIVDADPPRSGSVQYRVVYLDESRQWGPPSKSVMLDLGR